MKSRKGFFVVVLTVCLLFGLISSSFAADLLDISNHWAKNQIESWFNLGLAKGYPDQTYKPDKSITRAEFITLVNKAYKFNSIAEINYPDVSATDWFEKEIAKAKAAGYIKGYDDGTFGPNKPISRQEVAVIISRLDKLNSPENMDGLSKFKDVQDIAEWSKGAISSVVEKGYMGGYPDQTFKPTNDITRAESIVTLDRILSISKNITNYDSAGIYGTENGMDDVNGSVIISAKDVTLQNTKITGNLILAESIGDGNVTLKNVTVTGTTTIKGGGENSIYADDCTFSDVVTIAKADGKVRFVVSGNTSVEDLNIESGATLEEADLTGLGFSNVVVVTSGITVKVTSGTIDNLTISETATDTTVNISSGVTVTTLNLNAKAKIRGKGEIKTLNVGKLAAGSTIEQSPKKVNNPENIKITTNYQTGGGGGGGGGGSSDTITTYGTPGTYSDGTITGDVQITAADVTLQNMSISGNLLVAASVGEGNVTLDHVTVTGTTTIKGGGANSIHISNSTLTGKLYIIKDGGTVRIVSDASNIPNAEVCSDAILEGDFTNVIVEVPGIELTITDGTVTNLTLGSNATGSTVNVATGAKINNLIINAETVAVTGTGSIAVATINASGTTIEQTPDITNVDPSVTGGAQVGDSTLQPGTTTTSDGQTTTYTPGALMITAMSNATVDQNNKTIAYTNANNLSSAKIYVSKDCQLQIMVNGSELLGEWSLTAGSNEISLANNASGLNLINVYNVMKEANLSSTDIFDAIDFTGILNAVKNSSDDKEIIYSNILPKFFDLANESQNKEAIFAALNLSQLYDLADSATKAKIKAAMNEAIEVYNSNTDPDIDFSDFADNAMFNNIIDTVNGSTWRNSFYSAIDFTTVFDALSSSSQKDAIFTAIDVTGMYNALDVDNTTLYTYAASIYLEMENLSSSTKTAIYNSININKLLSAIDENNEITIILEDSSDTQITTTYTLITQ